MNQLAFVFIFPEVSIPGTTDQNDLHNFCDSQSIVRTYNRPTQMSYLLEMTSGDTFRRNWCQNRFYDSAKKKVFATFYLLQFGFSVYCVVLLPCAILFTFKWIHWNLPKRSQHTYLRDRYRGSELQLVLMIVSILLHHSVYVYWMVFPLTVFASSFMKIIQRFLEKQLFWEVRELMCWNINGSKVFFSGRR